MTGPILLGLTSSLIILFTLFEMMRRHRLREKYAVIWFVISVGAFILAAFPPVLEGISRFIGLEVPTNLLFFVASIVLLVLSLQHSYELGRLEAQTRTLAEELALLRLDVRRLDEQRGENPRTSEQEPDQDG
ncbi:MAG: DUF2304 domain-containing protein [Nocardioides sp.]|jgi:hypothetical protein